MKRIIYISIYLLMFEIPAFAQGDITLYQLRGLHQSTYLNPAFMPDYDVSVGVPVFSNFAVGVQLNAFDVNTILNSVNADNNLVVGDLYENFNNDLVGFKLFQQMDIFHVRQQLGHYQVGLSMGTKINSQTLFSKNFIGFPALGNGAFIGQNMSFSGNNIQVSSYVETGLSVAREFERFTVGVKLKMLGGIANVSTQNLTMNYYTSVNSYDPTTVTLGGTLNTCGLPYFQDSINGVKNEDKDFSAGDISPLKNPGFAFDIGATYRVTPRLNVYGAIIDMGSITWKSKPYNYNLNNVDVTYVGLSYAVMKNEADRTRYTDSLSNLIKTTTTKDAYSMPLVSRFSLGADYDLTLHDRVGFLFQTQHFAEAYFPSFTLSYTRKVGTNWDIATNYSYYNDSYRNLGLGTSIKAGAFQMYFITDDILVYLSPRYGRTVYFRFGFNLVWGAHRPRPRY